MALNWEKLHFQTEIDLEDEVKVKVALFVVALGTASLLAGQLRSQEDQRSTHPETINSTNTIVGQVPGYSAANANEEGYWYSRYSMMTLTMQSGLGTAVPMDANFQSQMMTMMNAVGAAPSDPVVPPLNPFLLNTAYAGGNPHYVAAPNQNDFSTLKWVGGRPEYTTLATATLLQKEVEWAKLFHRDEHFGQAGVDTFGSSQRFAGMIFATLVKLQSNAYFSHPGDYERSKDGDYALLAALSDAAELYSAADEANSQGPQAGPATFPAENRYADPAAAAMFALQARAQFSKVLSSHPNTTKDLSLAIQSVVWYGSITTNPNELAEVKTALAVWGNSLEARTADSDDGPSALAFKVRGLIEVGRVTGDAKYLDSAALAFNTMTANFDYNHGILNGTHKLTIDDIAEIAGAFNSASLWLGDRIDQNAESAMFGAWWEGTVDLSGIEISSPAVNQMKAPFELLEPPGRGTTFQPILNYRYPTVPLPENAGGPHGIAPVFAASVLWDGNAWHADQDRFDTAGAMHAANEMIWFHSDEINGFPTVTLP